MICERESCKRWSGGRDSQGVPALISLTSAPAEQRNARHQMVSVVYKGFLIILGSSIPCDLFDYRATHM
jgi:hypothetical protein